MCINNHLREKAFTVQNLIKTLVRKKLGSKNLEDMLRIVLEGRDEKVDNILKRQFFCEEKMELHIGFYTLTLHVISLLQ